MRKAGKHAAVYIIHTWRITCVWKREIRAERVAFPSPSQSAYNILYCCVRANIRRPQTFCCNVGVRRPPNHCKHLSLIRDSIRLGM